MNQDKLPRGDTAIVGRISELSGFRREEARISYQATMAAIREKLEAGEEVIFPGVGRFVFMLAKPRTIPARRGLPQLVLGERPLLKFRMLERFKTFMKSVKPKNPRKHQRWSDMRKASTLANQILNSEQTASPSNLPDREPSASSGQGGSSRTPVPSPDTAGTPSGLDCKSGSTDILPSAPSEPLSAPARVIEVTPVEYEQLLRSSLERPVPPPEAP
jgi:nucleoid DNA-binding protein